MIAAEIVHYQPDLSLGDLLVGFGTLALAGFTYKLARQTGREVDLTRRSVEAAEDGITLSREQVDLTRVSIEAQDRPFVIASANERAPHAIMFRQLGSGPNAGQWAFTFRLWNLGRGPAIVDGFSMRDGQGELVGFDDVERPISTLGGRDEDWPLTSQRVPGPGADCELRISYRSGSGASYETTQRLYVRPDLTCLARDYRRLP